LNPAGIDGELATTALPTPVGNVSVTFAGIPSAQILYDGPIPNIAEGFWQINAVLPNGLGSGPVAVQVSVGGRASQSSLMIYVR
jgi:uncharacterized protein (TIGR03437 family)